MRAILPLRKADAWGAGEYGAPRGDRTHRGIDFEAVPGMFIMADTAGVVTKLGYPYGDDLSFKYVEIQDIDGYRLRYFYVEPVVHVGHTVTAETIIGAVQSLQPRYEGITNHVHLEIIKDGEYVDPNEYYGRLLNI